MPSHVTEWLQGGGLWLSHWEILEMSLLPKSQTHFVHYRKRLSCSNPGMAEWSLQGLVKIMTHLPLCRVSDADGSGLAREVKASLDIWFPWHHGRR